MDGQPPQQRSPPRRYRDYDPPQEPRRYQDDSRPHEDGSDFRIKGQAMRDRSRSPPRGSRYDAPRSYEQRQRDTRYDNRSYGYGDDHGRRWGGRDDYDATVHAQHHVREPEPLYRGDGDIGSENSPLKFLLLRGLKLSTPPAVLAKGLEKLYRSDSSATGAAPGSLRSVMLMCDRRASGRLSFGFAWYHSLEDAKAALARARELGDEFTVSSQTITVDMPHMGVFPRTDFTNRRTDSRFTFVVPETGHEHEYKDEQYYPMETTINKTAPEDTIARSNSGQGEDAKMSDDAARKAKKRTLDNDQATTAPKRAQMNSAMSALTNRWSAQHAEIYEEAQVPAGNTRPPKQLSSGVNAVVAIKSEPPESEDVQTFAYDTTDKKCCFLCNRYLADSVVLKAHVEMSQLHTANLRDDAKVSEAYKRMAKAGVSRNATMSWETAAPSRSTQSPDPDAAQYVDRAALRRQEEKAQVAKSDKPKGFSLKNIKDPSHHNAPPPSKGLGMLQKHGYQAGQGLGAQGSTGMTAPIATDLYAAGVGLGHASGKIGDAIEEAERATKGDREEYMNKIKAVSRARYEAMNQNGGSTQ